MIVKQANAESKSLLHGALQSSIEEAEEAVRTEQAAHKVEQRN